jgi:plasmid stabilization system protein ParE
MTVEWSPLARLDYIANVDYLLEAWSEKEAVAFIDAVNYNISLLKENNIIFSKTEYKDVLKIVIVKQVSLYYGIVGNTIRLYRFWNNYQDLSKFKLD